MQAAEYPNPQPLRNYQLRAIEETERAWASGHRAVCLVAPTGAGKTRLAEEFIRREPGSVLFVVHRRELLRQTLARFKLHFDSACVSPGFEYDPLARVQIATVQTLLARQLRPDVSLVILDEAHHYAGSDWSSLAKDYAASRTVGLTATPERADGSPLGDVFSELVVGATYSELIADGHLVQCRVFAPDDCVEGLAQHPVAAWQRYAENSRAFLFASRVKHAGELRDDFRDAGIPSELITAETTTRERIQHLETFARGTTKVLSNVAVLTEGIDVPAARTCILARSCDHGSLYLQIVGRVLRPHPSKQDAILIDLTGATLRHGFPTEDRHYSLTGEAITRTSPMPLRTCKECGATYPLAQGPCPECGFVPIAKPPNLRIYDRELALVFAGEATPDGAKQREWNRLELLCKSKGWALGWAVQQYQKLFSAPPPLAEPQRHEVYRGLRQLQAERGYKPGFAAARFRALFGMWPPRSWS